MKSKGWVYKRGSTYSYVVDVGSEGGRRKLVWVGGFRTRKDALDARAEAVVKINAGTYVPTSRESLAEFLEEWLTAIRTTVRQSTWKSYGSLLRLHVLPRLGATQLRALRPAQLNKLYGELLEDGRKNGSGGLSRRTVRYTHTVLHRALRDAVRWGRVVRNVADLADPPAPARREMKVWTSAQLKTFLEHISNDRLHACYVLAATTGMRRGELLGLRWGDVDLEGGRLSVRQTLVSVDYAVHFSEPKTKRSHRTIGIDPATVAVLRAHRSRQNADRLTWGKLWEDTGLVFTQENGSWVHPQSLSEAFERHTLAAALPVIRFHDVRHTYATLALEAGMRPWDLSDRLGHSDTSMALDVYRHAIQSTQDEAAHRASRFILGTGSEGGC